MEYTTETEKELTFFFKAFVKGLIYEDLFCEKVSVILDPTFLNSFMEYHSRKVIAEQPPTKETLSLMEAVKEYINTVKLDKNEDFPHDDIYDERIAHEDIHCVTQILYIEWMLKYENEYMRLAKLQPQQVAKQTPPEQRQTLPKELSNDEAMIYWQKAKENGFVDDNYQFIGNKYQKAYFAMLFAEKLKIRHKWKPFQDLWKCKYLAQTNRETKERFGKVDRQKEIGNIFN